MVRKIIFTLFVFSVTFNRVVSQVLQGEGISLNNYGNSLNFNANLNPANTSLTTALCLHANTSSNTGASVYLWNNNNGNSYKNGSVDLCSYGTWGHGVRFGNYNPTTNLWTDQMTLMKDGKLIIGNPTQWGNDGTTAPGNYRLYVQHGILTERIKVAVRSTSDWSDYVFYKNYQLKNLYDVEKYIKKYKNLPNVPSANQVVNEGIDMVQMDATLLKKIEELTLYLIDLKKENDLMKKQIEILTKQIQL